MRRRELEITDRALIKKIIERAEVCRLGLCKDNVPYIVPVSFGFDGTCLYMHTAPEGQKIDYMNSNGNICFELECDVEVLEDKNTACKWEHSYYSVIGYGVVEELTEAKSRTYALNTIMKHYSGHDWSFPEKAVAGVKLWRISIEQMTGKRSKDKPETF